MMNSTASDDLSRVHLALEAAECLSSLLKNISTNTQNVIAVHKELLEINLSVTTYVEESKRRLDCLRTQLADEARSSQRVVEVLSKKQNMSTLPTSNADDTKPFQQQNAATFVAWYRNMIDNERQNFSLYLSDDATLEWFGRSIKTRRKISAFLNHGMQCTRHDFTTVAMIEKIQSREEREQRRGDSMLASPLHSPELIRSKPIKRRHSKLHCGSPEWAEGCQPDDEDNGIKKKKIKASLIETVSGQNNKSNGAITNDGQEISSNGDCITGKSKMVLITPPYVEIGQGDCRPSTSGADSDRSHEALTAQLPRLAVECNGYIEFTRSRNSRSIDSMKWERKCKVQISYSHDPLNVGEYIIWAIRYHDENKCRRNLLDAFEKVAAEEKL